MELIFDKVLTDNGYQSQIGFIKNLKKSDNLENAVKYLKNYYARPRPNEVAMNFGIKWKGDGHTMGTDDSYAYPSGHTAQAYYIAYNISQIYPKLKKHFFNVAEMVAQSRIDRGVHFPSDCEAGKRLAQKIYNGEKLK